MTQGLLNRCSLQLWHNKYSALPDNELNRVKIQHIEFHSCKCIQIHRDCQIWFKSPNETPTGVSCSESLKFIQATKSLFLLKNWTKHKWAFCSCVIYTSLKTLIKTFTKKFHYSSWLGLCRAYSGWVQSCSATVCAVVATTVQRRKREEQRGQLAVWPTTIRSLFGQKGHLLCLR